MCLLLAGWLNLLGQIAAVSAVAFLCKDIIATMAMMSSTVGGGEHMEFTPPQVCGAWLGMVHSYTAEAG